MAQRDSGSRIGIACLHEAHQLHELGLVRRGTALLEDLLGVRDLVGEGARGRVRLLHKSSTALATLRCAELVEYPVEYPAYIGFCEYGCSAAVRANKPPCRPTLPSGRAETNDGAGVVLMVAKLATVATTCGTRKTCLGVTVPASLHGRLMLPHGTGQSPPSVRKSDDLPDAFGP
jgi:hypothetical protein